MTTAAEDVVESQKAALGLVPPRVEVLNSEPVVLADDEKELLAQVFGNGSPISVQPVQCGVVYRLRAKLGLEK